MITHLLVATAHQTCEACPEQWEGTLVDGWSFYFRYRCGIASLAVAATQELADGQQHVRLQHGDRLQGSFESDAERDAVFAELLSVWHAE